MKKDKSYCSFGSFNVETGETQEGYVNKLGEMKYKKRPWYKRIFSPDKPPREISYIGTTTMWHKYIWSNNKTYFQAPVYKKYNPYTGEIFRVYAKLEDRTYDFSVEAFVKEGIFV